MEIFLTNYAISYEINLWFEVRWYTIIQRRLEKECG